MYKCFLSRFSPPLTAALNSVPAWGFQGSSLEVLSCRCQQTRFLQFVSRDVFVYCLWAFSKKKVKMAVFMLSLACVLQANAMRCQSCPAQPLWAFKGCAALLKGSSALSAPFCGVIVLTNGASVLLLQVFQGNFDNDTHRKNVIDPPIFARLIRILPWSWYGRITLRIEILGCTEEEWSLFSDLFFFYLVFFFFFCHCVLPKINCATCKENLISSGCFYLFIIFQEYMFGCGLLFILLYNTPHPPAKKKKKVPLLNFVFQFSRFAILFGTKHVI